MQAARDLRADPARASGYESDFRLQGVRFVVHGLFSTGRREHGKIVDRVDGEVL
jgi:hypothetical protein